MKVELDSIEEFFANCNEKESDMRSLDNLVREVTCLEPVLFGGMGSLKMLGYKLLDYKTQIRSEIRPTLKMAPDGDCTSEKLPISVCMCY